MRILSFHSYWIAVFCVAMLVAMSQQTAWANEWTEQVPHELLDTLKTYEIEEFTITENYRHAEVRTAAPLQILSNKQLNQLNVLQVSDAVKHFSGVVVKDYGGLGGLKTVSVRSLGAVHTAVSYDGIAVSDYQSGQIDIGRFSLDNVDMLSLNIGQSDNIFQPAQLFASASLINIRTQTPSFAADKSTKLYAAVKAGSFGLINPSFALQHRLNTIFSLSYGGEWLSAKGNYPYTLNQGSQNSGNQQAAIRKNSDLSNLRAEATLYAKFSETQSASLKTYFYDSDRGLPGATILYNDAAFISQRLHDYTFFTQAHYENHFTQAVSMQLNAKYQHGYVHYVDTMVLNVSGKEESIFIQNQYYLSGSLLYKAFRQLSFALSSDFSVNNMFAEYESASLTANFAQPVRYTWLSVLAAKYVSESFMATASLLSTITQEITRFGNSGDNQNRLSPFLSTTYKPFEQADLHIRAFYKNSMHLPTFNDLYYARVGNANLKPEITNQFNIGATYALTISDWLPFLSLTADVYKNHVKDKIVVLPTQNLFKWTTLNLGEVDIMGVDLAAETSIQVWKDFFLVLGGNYNYQSAKDITDLNSGTYGHQIPYTPWISGSGRVALETPWVNLSYAVLWSGKRYALFQNYTVNRLPAYSDHSISASRAFQFRQYKLSLQLEALNIFNENYAVVKWFPMPGREFRAKLKIAP